MELVRIHEPTDGEWLFYNAIFRDEGDDGRLTEIRVEVDISRSPRWRGAIWQGPFTAWATALGCHVTVEGARLSESDFPDQTAALQYFWQAVEDPDAALMEGDL